MSLDSTPIEIIASQLCTEARYQKAYQRVREDKNLDSLDLPHIGPCMKALTEDIYTEDMDWLKDRLWALYRRAIVKETIKFFPFWFKDNLNESNSEPSPEETCSTGREHGEEQEAPLLLHTLD